MTRPMTAGIFAALLLGASQEAPAPHADDVVALVDGERVHRRQLMGSSDEEDTEQQVSALLWNILWDRVQSRFLADHGIQIDQARVREALGENAGAPGSVEYQVALDGLIVVEPDFEHFPFDDIEWQATAGDGECELRLPGLGGGVTTASVKVGRWIGGLGVAPYVGVAELSVTNGLIDLSYSGATESYGIEVSVEGYVPETLGPLSEWPPPDPTLQMFESSELLLLVEDPGVTKVYVQRDRGEVASRIEEFQVVTRKHDEKEFRLAGAARGPGYWVQLVTSGGGLSGLARAVAGEPMSIEIPERGYGEASMRIVDSEGNNVPDVQVSLTDSLGQTLEGSPGRDGLVNFGVAPEGLYNATIDVRGMRQFRSFVCQRGVRNEATVIWDGP